MDATRILDTFYPGASKATRHAKKARSVWAAVRNLKKTPDKAKIRKWTPYLVVAALAGAVWVAVHLYYYNVLVDLEYNVQAGWAQVEVQLERRHYIQQNLTHIVMSYSEYEKDTLTEVIKIRAAAMAEERAADDETTDPEKATEELSFADQLRKLTKPELDKLFPDVLAVAEQYPDLKLTQNYQQFSTAIIDTETKIADRITQYNTEVNIYTTVRSQFPGNVFAAVFGFPPHEFHTPDKELLDFEALNY